jgi:TatD DNase family protein
VFLLLPKEYNFIKEGKMNGFVDTHCHLDFSDYTTDRVDVVSRAITANIEFIINPGIDLKSSKIAIDLAEEYPGFVYAAIGFHPNYGSLWNDTSFQDLKSLSKNKSVVAMGEIGLDFYREHTEHELQKEILREQLRLARELELPVLIHNRDSDKDLIPIISEWYDSLPQGSILRSHPGILHSFSSTIETAKLAMDMNFLLGITGPVTFKNATDRKQLVSQLPLKSLLLETDAPFLTPHPHRGSRNEPAYIPLIAAEIARLHGKTSLEVGRITTLNAKLLFRLT